jgi:hypothetical protein
VTKGYVIEFNQPYRPDFPMREETIFKFCKTKKEIKQETIRDTWNDTDTIRVYKANLELIETQVFLK